MHAAGVARREAHERALRMEEASKRLEARSEPTYEKVFGGHQLKAEVRSLLEI